MVSEGGGRKGEVPPVMEEIYNNKTKKEVPASTSVRVVAESTDAIDDDTVRRCPGCRWISRRLLGWLVCLFRRASAATEQRQWAKSVVPYLILFLKG